MMTTMVMTRSRFVPRINPTIGKIGKIGLVPTLGLKVLEAPC